MGQPFSPMTAERAVENFTSGLPFHHLASDTYFNVFKRSGKNIQRRWQVGFDGRETLVFGNQLARDSLRLLLWS